MNIERNEDEITYVGPQLLADSVVWSPLGARVNGGRYLIKAHLGDGGMGRVWLADNLVEKREVALKEIYHSEAGGEGVATSFRREFFSMRKLEHPGTVRVYDYGVLENAHKYITMEYVPGTELSGLKGPQPAGLVLDVLFELAQVLSFIHGRFFVHCDIKGSNIRRLPAGSFKLMDFGVMHQLGMATDGAVVGTPAYIAPEWLTGGVIDGRTDLYSLGVLAYRLATGQLPYASPDLATLPTVARSGPQSAPPRPSALVPMDPRLEDIIMGLLEQEPARRTGSARELLIAVAAAAGRALPEESVAARVSYLVVPEIVGRDQELVTLSALLTAPATTGPTTGSRRAVLIGAAAGVGKSRVLRELQLAASQRDIPFVVGRCRAEGLASLAPVQQVVRALIAISPPGLFDRYRAQLGVVLPAEEVRASMAPVAKPVVLEALVAWLRDLAAQKRFVVAFEDLHWADGATVELMNAMIRGLQGTTALVVGTYRPDEVDGTNQVLATVFDGAAESLSLGNLSPTQTEDLLRAVLTGFDVPAGFAAHLHQACVGNAFFTLECLRALIENDTLQLVAGRWQASADLERQPLPKTLDAVLRQRLATQTPEELELLGLLAHVGRVVDIRLMKEVLGQTDEQLLNALEGGIARQFLLYDQGQYLFSHDTVVQVAYESTDPEVRKLNHLRVAEAAERLWGAAPEMQHAIGYHYSRSTRPDLAIAPLVRAGEHARVNMDLVKSMNLLTLAVQLLDQTPHFPRREAILVEILIKASESAFMGNPVKLLSLTSRLFAHWESIPGLMKQGRAEVETALTEAASAEETERRGILERLYACPMDELETPKFAFVKRAELLMLQGIQAAAQQRMDVLETFNARVAEQPPQMLHSLAAKTFARIPLTTHSGQWGNIVEEVTAAFVALDEVCREINAPFRLRWAREYSYAAGSDFQAAGGGHTIDEARVKEALAGCDAAGFADMAVLHIGTLLQRAVYIGERGAFSEAQLLMKDASERLGRPLLAERFMYSFSPVYFLERGEAALATKFLEKTESLGRLLSGDRYVPKYLAIYKACLSVLGDEDGAAALLEKAKALVGAAPFRHAVLLWANEARFYFRRGQMDLARAAAARALARALDPVAKNPFDEILARRAVALVAEPIDALAELEKALAVGESSRNTLQLGLVHQALAVAWSRLGQDGSAHLTLAREAFARAQASELLRGLDASPSGPESGVS